MSKKVLAVILSLILTFSVITVPVGAADIVLPETSVENVFNMFIDQLLSFVLTYLNKYWPGYEGGWSTDEEYVPENFFAGEEEFDKTVSPDAQWKVGYAGASLLEGISPMDGDYYLAGYIEGRDYGIEADSMNLGSYKFVNGKLTVDLTMAAYVVIKDGQNNIDYIAEEIADVLITIDQMIIYHDIYDTVAQYREMKM